MLNSKFLIVQPTIESAFLFPWDTPMTSDERAQLIEDIRRAAKVRERIVDQARLDKAFDIAAAWEELEAIDQSINQRVIKSRQKK